MSIFKAKKRELPPLISDEELFPSVDYDTVLEWLLGLSDKEYSQVLQVAGIHRKANHESAEVLGKPLEPTAFIEPPIVMSGRFEDPLVIDKEPKFLTDDEPKPKKGKAIKVND